MRKIYTIIAALTLSAGLFAQTQDSLLKRQMELEREFNPTLLDADKINSLPALREPTVQKANTNYSTWAGRIAPPLEIALPRPGNIMTEIPYSMKRGFLFFNAGNYANLNGGLGYRLVENEKHNLAFTFLHSSTNSDINYVQEDSDPAGNNASMMDNLGKLSYNHLAETVKLNMHLSYLHSMFNYYGNTFGNTRFFDNEKNSLGVLNARVGLESVENDVLNYKGFIDFNNFNTKMSDDLVYNWMKGNQIHAGVGFDKPFGGTTSNKIGVDGSIFTAIYNGDVSNYFLINASPYISFSGLNRHAKLGADILFQTTGNTKIRVVPNVDLQLGFTEYSSVYATIRGGFDHNTLLDMMDESRYFMTYEPVKPSFSHIDLEAGFKIGELSGFRFDIFGGYRKTEDEHFLVVLNGQDIIGGDVLGPFTESLKPIYGTLSHSFIGGMIQSNIWSPLNIALRLKKNFYDATEIMSNNIEINDPMAYNKPGFETDMRATLEIVSNLKLTLNYYFAGDRWTYFNNSNIKMDNINDLNLGGVYEISDSFSLNVKANNILSQKYDIWYGYPAQGINVAGGFTFKF